MLVRSNTLAFPHFSVPRVSTSEMGILLFTILQSCSFKLDRGNTVLSSGTASNSTYKNGYSLLPVSLPDKLLNLNNTLDFCFINDKSNSGHISMFAMKDDSEIPCSYCTNWNSKARNFSCNPDECQKLTKWLFTHAQIKPKNNKLVKEFPIPYVV